MDIDAAIDEAVLALLHLGRQYANGLVLHGGTAVAKRRALVEDFQHEDGQPFLWSFTSSSVMVPWKKKSSSLIEEKADLAEGSAYCAGTRSR